VLDPTKLVGNVRAKYFAVASGFAASFTVEAWWRARRRGVTPERVLPGVARGCVCLFIGAFARGLASYWDDLFPSRVKVDAPPKQVVAAEIPEQLSDV
jgi:hypothetical protein